MTSAKGHDFSKLRYTDFHVDSSTLGSSYATNTITIDGAYMHYEVINDKTIPSGYVTKTNGNNSLTVTGPFTYKFISYAKYIADPYYFVEWVGYTIRVWYYPSSMASAASTGLVKETYNYRATINSNAFRLYTNHRGVGFIDIGCSMSIDYFDSSTDTGHTIWLNRNYTDGTLNLYCDTDCPARPSVYYYWV